MSTSVKCGRRLWIALCPVAVLLSTCSPADEAADPKASSGTPLTTGDPSSQSANAGPAPSPEDLKPVLTGLIVNRTRVPPTRLLGVVEGFVVDVEWADLQPSPGPIADKNPIDDALEAAEDASRSSGVPLRLKLRTRAGVHAPEWAKKLAGGPVRVFDGETAGTIGKFWTAAFGRAYEQLHHLLAERYDADIRIAQVEIARCTTFYSEPFLRQWGTDETQEALLKAGYTAEADAACQREQIETHLIWRQTRSGLMLNPYQRIGKDGGVTPDVEFTVNMMNFCRETLGPACVLENASVRWPLLQGQGYTEMYREIQARGAPVSLQTAAPSRIGDWFKALTLAAELGANSVELNRTYATYDVVQLQKVRHLIKANPTGR